MRTAARFRAFAVTAALAMMPALGSCGMRASISPANGVSERAPACVVPAQPDPVSERGKRVHRLVDELAHAYGASPADLSGTSAEDLAQGALAALLLAGDTHAAEALLRHLGQRQITDGSDARGRFASSDRQAAHPGEAGARTELGAVTVPLAALLTTLPTCFSAPYRRELDGVVGQAIAALRQDAVRVRTGSTRAWLQESVSLALLGEAEGDVAAAAQGHEQLAAWRKTVSVHGIAEYDASDGYAAALDALRLGDTHVDDRDARAVCHDGAELIERDLAAHWVAAHAAMAGPSSRLPATEGGEVRRIAELAGWFEPAPGTTRPPLPLRRALTLLLSLEGAALPDEDARAAFATPHVVTAVWEDPDRREPGRQTYTFVTPDVALGATSAAGSDRPLDAELAAPEAKPASVNVRVGETRLVPTITASQDRGALLVLVDAPAVAAGTTGDIVTDLAVPVVASGELLGPTHEGLGAAIGTRGGTGGLAVQLAGANGCHGAPRVELTVDAELAHLRIVHGDASRGACHPRTTFLILAGHAETHAELAALLDSARSPVTERVQDPGEAAATSTAWTTHGASVKIERGALRGISLTVERRTRPAVVGGAPIATTMVIRRVNGHPMRFGVLELDERNISPFVH